MKSLLSSSTSSLAARAVFSALTIACALVVAVAFFGTATTGPTSVAAADPIGKAGGKPVQDQHIHEHGTCFNVKDRGLVVISSCGHAGIVNTARQAMEVSGVKKLHAALGGFRFDEMANAHIQAVFLDEEDYKRMVAERKAKAERTTQQQQP